MNGVPGWVSSAVGIYAVLGSVFFVVLIVVSCYLLFVLADVAKQVKNLSSKVEALTDKVQTIADQVKSVTTEVGARTTGIVRMVDDSAGRALTFLEYLTPVLMIYGAFVKVRRAAAGRRK